MSKFLQSMRSTTPSNLRSRSRDSARGNDSDKRLQKEVESYIRKLELQKKNLQNIEETYAMVSKELKDQRESYEKCKNPLSDLKLKYKSKIAILENRIQNFITKYNQNITGTKAVREEIDVLRREVVIYQEVVSHLKVKIEKNSSVTSEASSILNKGISQTKETQRKIFLLKCQNEDDKKKYNENIEKLQKQILEEKIINDKNKVLNKKIEEPEVIDTKSLIKRRIQKIIVNCKEKAKLMEQYQKTMKNLDEAFYHLKEVSGMNDPEEIMATFIKSEEQNASIYTILDDMEKISKEKKTELDSIFAEIENEKLKNRKTIETFEKMIVLNHDTSLDNEIAEKKQKITEAKYNISTINPVVVDFLQLAEKYKHSFDLPKNIDGTYNIHEKNISEFLGVTEDFINDSIHYENKKRGEPALFSSTIVMDDHNNYGNSVSSQFDKRNQSFSQSFNDPEFDAQLIKNENKFLGHDEFMYIIKTTNEKKRSISAAKSPATAGELSIQGPKYKPKSKVFA